MTTISDSEKMAMTATTAAAYFSNNQVSPQLIQDVIRAIFAGFDTCVELAISTEPAPAPVPAVKISKSIQPDHIVCLEDGAKLKMLKRYLATHFKMTPDEYRAKWGLPDSYPMVAPAYAKRRSDLAKSIGLGKAPVVRAVA